jgi:DNA-directed RNA polymerase specialized sigma24 family protein
VIENHIIRYLEFEKRLNYLLSLLPSDYARLIILLHLYGWNDRQLAEVIGCSKQNILYHRQQATRTVQNEILSLT